MSRLWIGRRIRAGKQLARSQAVDRVEEDRDQRRPGRDRAHHRQSQRESLAGLGRRRRAGGRSHTGEGDEARRSRRLPGDCRIVVEHRRREVTVEHVVAGGIESEDDGIPGDRRKIQVVDDRGAAGRYENTNRTVVAPSLGDIDVIGPRGHLNSSRIAGQQSKVGR